MSARATLCGLPPGHKGDCVPAATVAALLATSAESLTAQLARNMAAVAANHARLVAELEAAEALAREVAK